MPKGPVIQKKDLKRAEEAVEAFGRLFGGNRIAAQRAARAGVDLSPTAQRLLWFIVTEGPIRISDLARAAGISDPIASRQVTALEEKDFVERLTSPNDGRVWLVRATSQGRRAGRKLRRATDDFFDSLVSEWSEADLADLTRVLERLSADLRRNGAASSPRE